jgi:hypothetical protein
LSKVPGRVNTNFGTFADKSYYNQEKSVAKPVWSLICYCLDRTLFCK